MALVDCGLAKSGSMLFFLLSIPALSGSVAMIHGRLSMDFNMFAIFGAGDIEGCLPQQDARSRFDACQRSC
jgi:hypothetical protein